MEVRRLHPPHGTCTPLGSVEFQEIVEVRRLHSLWKCGNPENLKIQTLTPPLEVWNFRKSWKSKLTPPVEMCNSMKPWKSDVYTPLCKCGFPGKLGSQTHAPPGSAKFQEIVEVNHIHPLEVWDSRKSWNSNAYTSDINSGVNRPINRQLYKCDYHG